MFRISPVPRIPRIAPRCRITLAAALALVVAVAAPSTLPAQAVDGVVVGQREAEPISGASLTLLDSVYGRHASTRTDTDGRFRLEAPAPGTWTLLLERPGHANELSAPLTLRAGETLEFRMEVESRTVERMAALSDLRVRREALTEAVRDECRADLEGAEHAVLTGVVRDSTSGIGLPGVGVVLEWGEEGDPRRSEVRARSDGSYTACAIPAGETVTLAIRDVEGGVPLAELVLEPGVVHVLDLPMEISTFVGTGNAGQILGRVWDEAGRPVSSAEVRVRGEGEEETRALTNARGVFVLEDVPAGPQVLLIEHLGYGTQERGLVVRAGRAHDVEIRLVTEPIELEPITVSVRSRRWFGDLVDLQHRMDLGFGHFLTREDFEARAQMPLGWAMSGIPGVRLIRTSAGHVIRFRRAPRTRACMMRGPVVYLDGMKYRLDPIRGYDEFNTSQIEAVELYAGPAQVPGQFGGSDAQCGVVAIWTRRPGS